MADLAQALQSTSVPTFLVFAGIITIFLSLGARLAPVEIPKEKRMIFGIMGSVFLLVGIVLFAWNPEEVAVRPQPTLTPTAINSPEPTSTSRNLLTPTTASTAITTIEPGVATPTAAPTSVPTPTVTNLPPASPTPEVEAEKAFVQTITTDVDVFYGPSEQNSRAGVLKLGDEVESIGKVRGGIWIEVVLQNGQVGWVDANKVEFIQGTMEDLPQTWPRTVTDQGVSGSGGSCGLKAFTIQDYFGTVWVRWQDLPANASWLKLTINAPLNGALVDLLESQDIDSSDMDTASKGFELGTWRFDPNDPNWKGFPAGTTYHFVLSAQDSAHNTLCTVQGDFIR